jgi:hypothetical protein
MYPEVTPIERPIDEIIAPPRRAVIIVGRAPMITRERTSYPLLVVPSGCAIEGDAARMTPDPEMCIS